MPIDMTNAPSWAIAIAVLASVIYQAFITRGQWRKSDAEASVSDADAQVKVSGAWSDFAKQQIAHNKELTARVTELENIINERDEAYEIRAREHEKASTANRHRIQELEATTTRLENERALWEVERREWRMGIGIIIEQLRRLEIEPKWTPPDTGPLTD